MKKIILPEILSIGIYNGEIAAKNIEMTKNRKLTMFEIELPIVEGGTCHLDSEAMSITTDMVICGKPGQIRHTRMPFKCYFIHMKVQEGELYDMLMSVPCYMKIENTDIYRDIFVKLYDYYNTALDQDQIMLQSLTLELTYLLWNSSQKQIYKHKIKGNNNEVIEKVLQYIQDNLTADLRLETVAAYASISPVYFHNCFKASTGKTLGKYVEEQRIRKAANLLISTNLTLSEIAYECGFSSQSYFSYVFKQKMKVTPREYVKEFYRRYDA